MLIPQAPVPAPQASQPQTGSTSPWYIGSNGATNFTRHEAQKFARSLLNSQTYRDSLEARMKRHELPPAVEVMLWHYAFGKPVEQVEVKVTTQDLSSLSAVELLEKADKLRQELLDAAAAEAAIPAEFRTEAA